MSPPDTCSTCPAPAAGGLPASRSPYGITLTGADERTDIAELKKLQAEIALLYSYDNKANRYPRWDWIREAALELPCASLHVCGRAARRQLSEGTLPVSGFQRMQINGHVTVQEVEHFCTMYPRITIITQLPPDNQNNRETLAVHALNHAVLWDGSGGRGLSPLHGWSSLDTTKPVGFAGGIGPNNIRGTLRRIRDVAAPGWWVDMESSLRADDWFDVLLAKLVVKRFHDSLKDLDED